MDISHIFHGPNSGYLLELYERYLEDPDSLDSRTRALFERWKPELPEGHHGEAAPQNMDKIVATANLAQAIRAFGHLAANIDPMNGRPKGDPVLELKTHKLTEDDLFSLPSSLIEGEVAESTTNAD